MPGGEPCDWIADDPLDLPLGRTTRFPKLPADEKNSKKLEPKWLRMMMMMIMVMMMMMRTGLSGAGLSSNYHHWGKSCTE